MLLKIYLPTGLKFILVLLCVLISVAFVTLLERKFLGYSQIRKGPNKVGVKGLLQPFSDALKLFTKEPLVLFSGNHFVYWASAILSLVLALSLWIIFPADLGAMEVSLSLLFLLCVMTAGVYSTLGAGWSSNSKYSLLGGLRAVAQTISYEVSLAFLVLSVVAFSMSYCIPYLFELNKQWLVYLSPFLGVLCLVTALAETSRTPFDFSEGESELVSGFNTEFSAGPFALFFLAEYSSILFMSLLTVVFFLGGFSLSLVWGLKVTALVVVFIWVRATLPRLRYDKLMNFAWKILLPISLNHLVLFLGVTLFLTI